MRLKDKVIIVTGGANGIGRRYCQRMAAEGARLLIADIDLDSARELEAELNGEAAARRAVAMRVDVTSEENTEAMAQTAVDAFGRIDVLVNNAGTYPHVEFEDITYEAWRKVITVNLDSMFLCSKAVLPPMKRQGGGKIINVATDLVWVGLPGMVHYIAAKSGVIGFTRSLARELGQYNITVNAMAPGAVIPQVDNLSATARQRVGSIVGHQALKRPLQAEDLVGPMVFLCSADADFISGQILSVDGGLTNH